jgi:enterochelin esterase-like enzyme
MANCTLWFDLSGEHDWSYWREHRLDEMREAIRQ